MQWEGVSGEGVVGESVSGGGLQDSSFEDMEGSEHEVEGEEEANGECSLSFPSFVCLSSFQFCWYPKAGEREGKRKRGRGRGVREGERKGETEGGREGGNKERGREGGREGGKEGGREGKRKEEGRERGSLCDDSSSFLNMRRLTKAFGTKRNGMSGDDGMELNSLPSSVKTQCPIIFFQNNYDYIIPLGVVEYKVSSIIG